MLSGVLQSAKKKIRKVQHEMDIYRLRKAAVDLGNVSSVHLSLDDAHQVFIDAQRLHQDSLFDLPLLSELKRLNELYGAKFTLYCFEDSAYRLSEECFAEIKANENWLQVGYHAGIDGNVTVESYQRFRSYFSEQKIKLASSLRLHYFDCPEELKGVLSADGVRRLFCSDEGRDSYGLAGKIYGGVLCRWDHLSSNRYSSRTLCDKDT